MLARGAERIWAFHKFSVWRPYHSGFAGVSDRLTHVLALLLNNGYLPLEGETADVIFEQDYSGLERPAPPDGFEAVVTEEPHKYCGLETTVRIMQGDREVGVCEATPLIVGCPSRLRNTTFAIGWIHVEPGLRRRAMGRYLLDRTAWEMKRHGYSRGLVQCNLVSPSPMSFYSNCGFTLADIAWHELSKVIRR